MKIAALVCTLNEAVHIGPRLANLMSQDIPEGVTFSVHVLDNGSTDATVAIANAAARDAPFPICVHVLPPIGKCAALFWAFENLQQDLFVLTDANTVFAPAVIRAFYDNVSSSAGNGLYVGNTRSVAEDQQGKAFLASQAPMPSRMRGERAMGISTGANGACYGVRRVAVDGIWQHPPVRNDDFVISVYAGARHGVAFVENARAYEAEAPVLWRVWRQKYRDALGHNQAIFWILRAVPTPGSIWAVAVRLAYWSLPFLLVAAGFLVLGWYLFPVAGLLLAISRKLRLTAARTLALALGYIAGAIKPPAPKWQTQR